jgi:dTDP-glucose 4,6-dehydratase
MDNARNRGRASRRRKMTEAHHPRRILLTGGAGFIGSNLVHHLLGAGVEHVVDLDLLTYAGDRANLLGADPNRHLLVKGDIRDAALVASLLREHRVDTVMHLAAESHVDRSITGSAPFIETNIVGTFVLLEAARRYWLDEGGPGGSVRFHHVSTDEVYGDLGPDDPPFGETTPYHPSSPYSASKAASDHLVRAWGRTYRLPFTVSNCSNNYGPRQHDEKLIPTVLRSCRDGNTIPVYGRGENVRDWLHVRDHADALWYIVRHGEDGETYNVGGENEWKNLDLVRLLVRVYAEAVKRPAADLEALIGFVTDRPGHDRRYAIDGHKLAALGWRPQIGFEDGLRETVAWYLRRWAR